MKLVGISGSLTGSKTSKAVHEVLAAAKRLSPSILTELIDLKDYDVEFVTGKPLTYYNSDTWKVVQTITEADFLVIGTPIYQASITGALKNLFDHLAVDVFKSKAVGVLTTGGSDKHFLVAEYQLKPIISYLKGTAPASSVFVHSNDFNDDNEIAAPIVLERIEKLARELITLQESLAK
jgi:FMN reductase